MGSDLVHDDTRNLAPTRAWIVTSQFSESEDGIPDNVSPFQDSQGGKLGDEKVTGMFDRDA